MYSKTTNDVVIHNEDGDTNQTKVDDKVNECGGSSEISTEATPCETPQIIYSSIIPEYLDLCISSDSESDLESSSEDESSELDVISANAGLNRARNELLDSDNEDELMARGVVLRGTNLNNIVEVKPRRFGKGM